MTMKALLLGAAAGVVSIGSSQAADLPMTKGEAVEYVKVCSTFGPGFFYIPGSDTCLKIGGEIRADYRVFGGNGFTRNDNRSAFNTQARIWFDARTQTDWGLLRSYFQINADSHPISRQGRFQASSPGSFYNGNTFTIDKAFIQFGGLTAGYAHSFFGFYDNEYGDTIWGAYYSEVNTVNLLAYTAQFGGGFSATLALEDGRDHHVDGDLVVNGVNRTLAYGGQQVPDVVGQLRYDADWGSLSAQAAGHQFRSGEAFDPATGLPIAPGAAGYIQRENKYGWAAGATALFKFPQFVNGGYVIFEGQYADGALDYLGAGNTWLAQSDYFAAPSGRVDAGKGWSITGELGADITPQLKAVLVGSYIDVKYDSLGTNNQDISLKEFTVTGNLTYTIVKGLTAAAEVAYTHGSLDNAVVELGNGRPRDDYNVWQGGIRLKRTF
ncbi:polymerase [Labrys miyagiensis]